MNNAQSLTNMLERLHLKSKSDEPENGREEGEEASCHVVVVKVYIFLLSD